jgi:predicted permease
MKFWTEFQLRLRALFQKERLDAQMDEEMRSHLEMQTRENIEAGMNPEEARYAALRQFGWVESIKETCRDQRGVSWIENLGQDIRYGARMLRKNPGFTAVAVLTLALGIGANTALFSIINAVLLRPLPYPEPDRLVAICESNPRLGWDQYVTSMGAFSDWRQQSSAFQELAGAMVLGPTPVADEAGTEMVNVASVSANFFPLLGIEPILGRQFLTEEETPDNGSAVLLSEGLWHARFGASPAILNQTIRLGERSFTVVGVMPEKLKLFDPSGVQGWDSGFSRSELWRPLPVNSGLKKQRNFRAFLVLGRLKSDVSLVQAQTEMTTIARQQARQFPESNAGWGITVQPWNSIVIRKAKLPLLLLFGAVGLVLVIATANLANMCLARAAARQREVAVRMALGAGRFRIARQFLAESLLLSCLGGLSGLWLAQWSLHLLVHFIPANVPRTGEITLDGQVLGFTFMASVVVGVLFGLAPILTLWRRDVNIDLKQEARGSTGSAGGRRLRASLVVSQVALVMMLLSGAGLLMRSLWRLSAVDPGFRPKHLVAADVPLNGRGYTNGLVRIQAVQALLNTLSDQQGSDRFAAVDGLPLDSGRVNMDIALTSIEGVLPTTPEEKRIAGLRLVSPDYFRTMGIPVSRGRFFSERDNTNATPVVIINEALARRYFSGIDPLGKRMSSPDFGPEPCEIVGIVGDVRHAALDASPQPEAFRPLFQECFSSITLVARSQAAPDRILETMRNAVAVVDRNWPVYNLRPLERLVTESLAPRRFALLLMELFAGLGLLMALVGIYAVLSCVAGERTREIGIRLALGARRSDVIGMVLKHGMGSVALGGLIGLVGTFGLTKVLSSLLYNVSPIDPLTLAVVSLLLVVMALLACYIPAHRAAKVDPMVALRYE